MSQSVMETERNTPRYYPRPPVAHRQAVARPFVTARRATAGLSPFVRDDSPQQKAAPHRLWIVLLWFHGSLPLVLKFILSVLTVKKAPSHVHTHKVGRVASKGKFLCCKCSILMWIKPKGPHMAATAVEMTEKKSKLRLFIVVIGLRQGCVLK